MKQEHVFASYVQRMLTHRNSSMRYTPQQTIHWLSPGRPDETAESNRLLSRADATRMALWHWDVSGVSLVDRQVARRAHWHPRQSCHLHFTN